jgi:NAD(P)-dependent dehydrogenase (short-subunit alcohol dehydrogenase family)
MTKTALITGITGQDGSYLAELLLDKGYEIYGVIRRLSTLNITRIENIADRITLLEGDLTDQSSLNIAMPTAQPDECQIISSIQQRDVGGIYKTCRRAGTERGRIEGEENAGFAYRPDREHGAGVFV